MNNFDPFTRPLIVPEVISTGCNVMLRGNLKHGVVLNVAGYTLRDFVARGSYGQVKMIEEKMNPNNRFAVKIMNRNEVPNRFLVREINIITQIYHPNIVRTHRILYSDCHVYVVMELAEKGDLVDYLRLNGPLNEERAKIWFQQLIDAVNYLHSRQIAHRDLKCENILVFNKDCIKVTDFGFSRKCIDLDTGKRILSRTFCGSLGYTAPEVIKQIPYNPKMADVWSLGCILFSILTGKMAFEFNNTNPLDIVAQQEAKNIEFPQDIVLSVEAERLIRHMLEPDVCCRAIMNQVIHHKWLTS